MISGDKATINNNGLFIDSRGLLDNYELEAIYKSAPIGMCALDKDLRFVRVNDRFAEINGVAAKDHIGKTPYEVVPDLGKQAEAAMLRILETGEPLLNFEISGITPAQPGVQRYWNENWIPLKDMSGIIIGVSITAEETTERKQVEEALRVSEARFQVLVDSTAQAVWETNAAGEVVADSSSWQAYTGLTTEEYLGYVWVNAIHPDDQGYAEKQWREAVAAERNFNAEFRLKDSSGEWKWYNVHAAPIRGLDGKILNWLVKREEKLRKTVEKANEGIVQFNSQGIITYVTETMATCLGYSVKEMLGRPALDFIFKKDLDENKEFWMKRKAGLNERYDKNGNYVGSMDMFTDMSELKHVLVDLLESEERFRALVVASSELMYRMSPDWSEMRHLNSKGFLANTDVSNRNWLQEYIPKDEQPLVCAIINEAIRNKVVFELEHRVWKADGNIGWTHSRAVPIVDKNGEIVEWFGMANDITSRKQAEELYESEKRALALVEQLRLTDQNKNDFLSTLSHELRNPLASITMSLALLDRVHPGSEQARQTKEVIERQTAQLSHLVDDLLDITRITRNKIELKKEQIELNELVRRTVADYQEQFEKKEAILATEFTSNSLYLEVDPVRITQVIGNLLNNAAKFTAKGNKTIVTVTIDEHKREAVIRVKDNGLGISPESLPILFQPFVQADKSLDRKSGGLGLGLVIVKGIVELHGGSVTVHSKGLGKGTEFTIRLPLPHTALSKKVEVTPSSEKSAYARRILVIDDIPDIAEILCELLSHLGHEVVVAYNGPDGIAKAKEYHPELLVCDIGLPGMSGYEVARHFRNDPELKDIFLIALSGYALPEDLEKSRAAGFDRHLAKPVDLDTLEQTLAEVQM